MFYRDYRDGPARVKTDNRPLAARQADLGPISITTLGGHYVRNSALLGSRLDVLIWGAWQTGAWGNLDHSAWAAALEAGVQPALLRPLRPWLRAGWYRGSGDDDASDQGHGTFFQLLPTPRIYARLPFYNLMNLDDRFVTLILRPTARITVRADARSLRLTESRDLWYSGGGAFQEQTFGFAGRPANSVNRLASLLDLSVDTRLTDRLSANAYLGWALSGPVIDRIYPDAGTARLLYLELEYRR